jgi:cation-transporting ATPase 13A1
MGAIPKDRGSLEKDMVFAGFLILECPLKPDSKHVIGELIRSGHECVMITGDGALTAVEVAKQVGMMTREAPVYELQSRPRRQDDSVLSGFEFVPLSKDKDDDELQSIPLSNANMETLRAMKNQGEAFFCISGSVMSKVGLAALQHVSIQVDASDLGKDDKNTLLHPAVQSVLKELVLLLSVFARHAPRQKEAVIAAYNLAGMYTLMAGDGTNDVGALKRCHVGISIISAPEIEAKQRVATETIAKEQKKERKARKEGTTKFKKKSQLLEESLRQLQEAQNELDHVELGDASVASPFTSRAMSIKCCKDILQQGRCTLVTMLTIYKILGVNCLVNALVLTKLHMHGVKQGDRQLTILGVVVAALFLFVTRGKPLPTLSPTRPPSSVLCPQALISIVGQFAVHLLFIVLATDVSLAFVDPYDPSIIPDASFNPNVLNSCAFLLTMIATVNTFVVNYRGEPFMQNLRKNKMLFRSTQVFYVVLFASALEVFPPLNDLLQLAPFPETQIDLDGTDDWAVAISEAGGVTRFVQELGFPVAMSIFMALDTILAFTVEKIVLKIFP